MCGGDVIRPCFSSPSPEAALKLNDSSKAKKRPGENTSDSTVREHSAADLNPIKLAIKTLVAILKTWKCSQPQVIITSSKSQNFE